jgi:hypothetical protein
MIWYVSLACLYMIETYVFVRDGVRQAKAEKIRVISAYHYGMIVVCAVSAVIMTVAWVGGLPAPSPVGGRLLLIFALLPILGFLIVKVLEQKRS